MRSVLLLAWLLIAVPLVALDTAAAQPPPPECISFVPCCDTPLCVSPEPCRPIGDKYWC